MNNIKIAPRLVFAITNPGNEKKVKEVFDQSGVGSFFTCHGQGTAPSAMMALFGLTGREKIISAGFTDKSNTGNFFKLLDEKMSFSEKGRGIAFAMAPSSMQSLVMSTIKKEEQGDENEMNEQVPYTAILAAVAGGFSDDVVEAARSAGARGGTIIKGTRDMHHEVSETLGVPLVEEQEFVLILVPREMKASVMDAITSKCGIKTEAHGIVSSFPVDEVFGIK